MDPNSLMPENTPSWLAEYKDFILVLAGGFCAAFGGFVSTYYRARKARSIKMREEIGRQQVEIYNKALRLTGGLGAILLQGTSTDVLNWMQRENAWVLDSEVLLPQEFVECWHSVKLNVKSVRRQEQAQYERLGHRPGPDPQAGGKTGRQDHGAKRYRKGHHFYSHFTYKYKSGSVTVPGLLMNRRQRVVS